MTHDDDRSPRPHEVDRDETSTGPLDDELSALLDAELDADAAAALRDRMVAEPSLAARFAQMGEVDGQLRRLAAELPDADRLARLRTRLQARIDAGEAGDSVAGSPPARPVPHGAPARVVRLRPHRFLAPAAAALAAGLVLYLLSGPAPTPLPGVLGDDRPGLAHVEPSASDAIADTPDALADNGAPVDAVAPVPLTPGSPTVQEARLAGVDDSIEPRSGSAQPRSDAAGSGRAAAPDGAPSLAVVADSPPADSPLLADDELLASASEFELAVALRYEVLSDLDVIENLELLELLAMLDGPEAL